MLRATHLHRRSAAVLVPHRRSSTTNDVRFYFVLLVLVVASIALTPHVRLNGGLPAVRLEDVLLLLVVPVVTLVIGTQVRMRLLEAGPRSVRNGFLYILAAVFLSTSYGALAFNVLVVPADLFELMKPVRAMLVFLLGAFVARSYGSRVLHLAEICLAGAAAVGVLQWLRVPVIMAWSELYMRSEHQYIGFFHGVGRIVGTVGNPIIYSMLICLGLALSVSGVVFRHNVIKNLILTPLYVFVIFATGSRTALGAALVTVLVVAVCRMVQRDGKKEGQLAQRFSSLLVAVIAIVLGVGALVAAYEVYAPDYTKYRVEGLVMNPSDDGSLQDRLGQYRLAFDEIERSPILGWGPAKSEMTRVLENEYLLLLRQYGLIGLTLFMWPMLLCCFYCLRQLRKPVHTNVDVSYFAAGVAAVPLAMTYMAALFFFHELQVSLMYWVVWGVLIGSVANPQVVSKRVHPDLTVPSQGLQ